LLPQPLPQPLPPSAWLSFGLLEDGSPLPETLPLEARSLLLLVSSGSLTDGSLDQPLPQALLVVPASVPLDARSLGSVVSIGVAMS
jgi:hypothetical protein